MKQTSLTITKSITISRSIGDVFAVLTEPHHAKHWISLLFDAELLGPKPIDAGSTAWYMVKLLGKRIRVEGHWLRYEAPFVSVFETTTSPLHLHVTYRCQTVPTGTSAEITAVVKNSLFFGVASNTIRSVLTTSFAHDLNLLKTYMEHTPRMFDLADA